jgi:signal peptidase I
VNWALLQTGLKKEEILIAGTGSMYPTFPKSEAGDDIQKAHETVAWPRMRTYPQGINIFGFNLFNYSLQRGDIVEFTNEKTNQITKEKYGEEAGFVKRLIGLPGDIVEIRDGFVFINNKRLDEPYTAKPRSTYGGDFISDCRVMEVPDNQVFVLGDNRKASFDSRFELGFVPKQDIHYVLPFSEQQDLKTNYRDTTLDSSLAQKITLNGVDFVALLNQKRQEKNIKPIKYNTLLSNSAKIRGFNMIKYDDFSTEASRSGVSLQNAMRQAGYRNIINAELFVRGYFEASELLENLLTFPEPQSILFSEEYQDIGVEAVLGEISGCPVQVVVLHFGGYKPPSYTEKEKNSWREMIENIEEVLPSWKKLKGIENVDQEKLDKLINLMETRLSNAKQILSRLDSNQWLNEKEEQMVSEDETLAKQSVTLIEELNK